MRTENMKVLIVGSGAREHALAQSIRHSPRVHELFCTTRRGGFVQIRDEPIADDNLDAIVQASKEENIDLVVIGPEMPLIKGLVDMLAAEGIAAFGPTKQMAKLEGSKAYTKNLCWAFGIPTAPFHLARTRDDALHFIRMHKIPPVIKADGPRGGKGVTVPKTHEEAIAAAEALLMPSNGSSENEVIVIEERIEGRECSVLMFCDGENITMLPLAQDYKRARDNNEGPNTGGMGAYSPVNDIGGDTLTSIRRKIIFPLLKAFKETEGVEYRGLLYAGIMVTSDGPLLLEINVRFGDPEAQVILPRIESDIIPYMLATLEASGLDNLPTLQISSDAAVCIVLASDGYPGKYQTDFPISGYQNFPRRDVQVFDGAVRYENGSLITNGGRVMSVVGMGKTIPEARALANESGELIHFENKCARSDIAAGIE